jgi:imidazole glycerol phosphate synthase glutamine amidotransferase subunit
MMIGLMDYDRGNLRSVEKALERLGVQVKRVSTPSELKGIDAMVLPGVGAFGDAMQNLTERKLVEPIKEWLAAERPFLGICLGYQLLFEESEETPGIKGLSFFKGKVVRFPSSVGKVPHIGWNLVRATANPDSLMKSWPDATYFYHVHSYYPADVPDSLAACTTTYGNVTFASGLSHGQIHAFQFHPEKSQESGRRLLQAFVERIKTPVLV